MGQFPGKRPVLLNYDFRYFFPIKWTHSNLKTKLRTFPLFSRVPQSKFEANRSRGSFVMIGHTNKQILLLHINRKQPGIKCMMNASIKDVRQGKSFQKCTHLQYCSVLSLGANVNTSRMSKPDMGSIIHKKINEIFWSQETII